jgi:predicted DCC family thiol-disulfide oxidoreductase YuxK
VPKTVSEPAFRKKPECLLIYDGECRLCVTAKEGLDRVRRVGLAENDQPTVRFVPYHSEEAARRLGNAYQPGRPEVAFLIDPQGGIHRGLDAFLPLLPGLPGGRVVAWLTRVSFLRPLATLLYRVVAKNRYRWFGGVSPTSPDSTN